MRITWKTWTGIVGILVVGFIILSARINATASGISQESPQNACALLDNPSQRALMSGMFETKLLLECGRANELGQVTSQLNLQTPLVGTDVQVNDRTGESGTATTQSETSLALNENTGTLCSGFNDGYGGVVAGTGYTGFSSSTDGGLTFVDHGGLGSSSFGDPSIIWRKNDGKFYIGTIHASGMGFWRSDDDCTTFTFVGNPHLGGGDDKELFAVDNNVSSPFYGRIYMAWTDFNAGARIYAIHSDNGTTWSSPVALSTSGVSVQGAWPVVAPNGDVYVGWVRWNPYPTGPIDIEIVRSTNGGVSFTPVTNPLTGGVNPRDNTATSACGRPALNGNIRYLPSPQLTVSPNGDLHVAYVRDPDGNGTGDVINTYYRRSTDDGATWGPEIQTNDDGTTTDQFFPTLSSGPTGRLVSTWYDRRLDTANNYLFDYYMRVSNDGGTTWLPSQRVSDVSSPVYNDPNLATCYHGDYDQQTQDAASVYIQWSDDRNTVSSHADPDVWVDQHAFYPDFTLAVTPETQAVCTPDDAVYTVNIGQVQGYSDPVTLSTSGEPAGTSVNFSTNPVTPPGSSTLTIGNTGAAAAGSYLIDVTGTAPTSTHTTQIALDVSTAVPGSPTLTAPANGATNIPTQPTFQWDAVSGAASYFIEIATDAGFTNLVDSASVATTSYTPGSPLNTSTTYYWRVTASNACGDGAVSTTFTFTTLAAPGDCSIGQLPNPLLAEGFESGATPPGWSHSGTGDTWAASTLQVYAGTYAFRGQDPATVSEQYLYTPPIVLPADEFPLSLQFWNYQEIEDRTGGCYDGALLDISTDGGSTWTQIETGLLTDPYEGPISTTFGNPRGGDNAWCGDPQAFLESVIDLNAYAGQTIQFRFGMTSDNSVSRPNGGWFLDEVVVQSCVPDTLPVIEVAPASLSSAQGPDTLVTQTLTISNTGDAALNWSITEDLDTPARGQGTPARLGTPPARPTPLNPAPFLGGIVADPSFEAGTPNPFWSEASTNFGTPLCDPGSCGLGGGSGPHTGNWWAWFGGITIYEEGSVAQNVTLPNGSATLSFWLEVPVACNNPTDYLEVLVDSTQVFLVDGTSPLCGVVGYSLQTVDLSAYADGGSHALEFHSEIFGGAAVTNFFVDDVAIEVTAPPALCSAPEDLPWVSVNPAAGSTAPGSASAVAVVFDTTGLSTGTYTGTLCVSSNDVSHPLVTVPLTLTVETPVYGVSLGADAAAAGLAGSPVTYTLAVENTGNVADSFALTVSGNAWPTSVTPSSVTLNAGASTSVVVAVDVPAGATAGDSDAATVTATSQGDGSVSDSATFTTTAQTRGVALAAAQSGTGAPGTLVTYTLTVANTGSLADTYAVTVSGNGWTTTVAPSSVPLNGGATATLTVVVSIPAGAADGETDSATVTVTSQAEAALSASVVLTTTAQSSFSIFLPIVTR